MNIFAVKTNVVFHKKPEWLDLFFDKHNLVKYGYHITLKQSCIIAEENIEDAINKFKGYFDQNTVKVIPIVFDELVIDPEGADKNDACIMLNASNEQISKLQKGILFALNEYRDYVNPETELYEKNFKPHITIAANLDKTRLEEAQKDLKPEYRCECEITQVILVVLKDFSPIDQSSREKQKIVIELDRTKTS